MRAVIYTRVSSDPTGRGRSVTEQESECRAICEREGWTVAEVLTDNDIGASRHSGKDRPAYRKLADTLQRGDVLVTWEASRAQRDLAAYVELRNLCAERDVRWSYSGKLYDLGRGDDRFTTGLDALLAEKEAEQIRERVLRAQRANAEMGLAHGRIPYGYLAVRDNATGKIVERVPHPEQAPIVKEIVARFLAGESLWAITKDLNDREIATPGTSEQWRASILTQMLKRPTYAGLRTHKGAITGPGNWEGLISEADYNKLIAVLTNPARVAHHGTEPKHLLSGIAICGVCKAPVHRLKNGGYPAYVCSKGRCVGRNIERVDLLVTERIIKRLEDPAMLGTIGVKDDNSQPALDEIARLRASVEQAAASALAGDMTWATVGKVEIMVDEKIKELQKTVQRTVKSPLVSAAVGPQARDVWEEYTIPERRELIRTLVSVVIEPTNRAGRVFDPRSVVVEWDRGYEF